MGEQLARTELFLLFTTMLQNFVFTCEDVKTFPTIHDASLGFTLLPPLYQVMANPLE